MLDSPSALGGAAGLAAPATAQMPPTPGLGTAEGPVAGQIESLGRLDVARGLYFAQP